MREKDTLLGKRKTPTAKLPGARTSGTECNVSRGRVQNWKPCIRGY